MSADPSILDRRVRAALDDLGLPYEVLPCEPELADTAAFAAHYDIPLENSANTIVVASTRGPRDHVACLALATTRLDVNGAVRRETGFRKASFAGADEVRELTGMEIGGVTAFGLPGGLDVLVDAAVVARPWLVLGGGNRLSKLRVGPELLRALPGVRIVEGLAG